MSCSTSDVTAALDAGTPADRPDSGIDADLGMDAGFVPADAGAPLIVDAGADPADASVPLIVDAGVDPADASVPLIVDATPIEDPDAEVPDDCDPDGPIHPGAIEIIDGLDNDCDGLIDEVTVCAAGGTPFATITAGIAAAPPGAVVEVCAGTYHERLAIAGKPNHLLGLDGAVATILDADTVGSAVTVAAVGGAGVTIEGFTIRGGETIGRGAGVRCDASTLRVLSSVITGNTAGAGGGGLSATGCVVDIVDTRIEANHGGPDGGGAYITGGSGQLLNAEIVGNYARHGAGARISDSSFAVHASSFVGNVAELQGGGLHYGSDAAVEDSVFDGNTAGWTGGGIYLDGHAPELRGNAITGNLAVNDGGGIYVHQSSGVVADNVIDGNESGDDGGGMRVFESSLLIERNVVDNNYAGDGGGGIRISHVPCGVYDNVIRDNDAYGAGGGVDLDNDSSVIIGGSITGNTAGRGGGIHGSEFPWFGATIADVELADNYAWTGGAIHLEDNYQLVELRGLFVHDNSSGHGAGLNVQTTAFTLKHSLFVGNHSYNEGGAITVGRPKYPWWRECPCPPTQATGSIEFVVAYANTSDEDGSGLWTRSPDLAVASSIWFANSGVAVVASLPPEEPEIVAPTWRYNDTFPATFLDMSDPTGTEGNLAVDPQFVAAAGLDYHLLPASACIDAGDPALTDGDGTRADMGVFGGPGATP